MAPDPAVVDDKVPSAESASARSASGEGKQPSDLELQTVEKPRKRWYKRLNPLRWEEPPPVPEERTVSKEYGAGFFSIISFQWMSPLMRVSSSLLSAS